MAKIYDVKYAVVTRAKINGQDTILGVEHKSDSFTGPDDLDIQVYLMKKERMPKDSITVESVSKQ
jgi:hypothetical protein